MWRTTEPIPVPTGSAIPLVANPNCQDQAKLASTPGLASACACERATNEAINLTNTYVQQVEKYNTDLATYNTYLRQLDLYEQCAKNGNCTDTYASFQADFDTNYKNQKKYTKSSFGCATADQKLRDQYCKDDYGSGWNYVEGSNVSAFCNTSPPSTGGGACCTNKCQRSLSQAQKEWNPVFRNKQLPPTPVARPTPPEFDGNIVITCCSQNFNDIEGDTVKIYDITQTCTAEVNQYINDVASGTTTAPPPNPPGAPGTPQAPADPEAPRELQTTAIVLIVVAVAVFIAMMIWVAVRLRKRQTSRASASSTV